MICCLNKSNSLIYLQINVSDVTLSVGCYDSY